MKGLTIFVPIVFVWLFLFLNGCGSDQSCTPETLQVCSKGELSGIKENLKLEVEELNKQKTALEQKITFLTEGKGFSENQERQEHSGEENRALTWSETLKKWWQTILDLF